MYDVEFDGEMIVAGARDPDTDLARALLARGFTGKVKLLDAVTGKPRTIIDINKAARVVAEESRYRSPRFCKFRPGTFISWLTRKSPRNGDSYIRASGLPADGCLHIRLIESSTSELGLAGLKSSPAGHDKDTTLGRNLLI